MGGAAAAPPGDPGALQCWGVSAGWDRPACPAAGAPRTAALPGFLHPSSAWGPKGRGRRGAFPLAGPPPCSSGSQTGVQPSPAPPHSAFSAPRPTAELPGDSAMWCWCRVTPGPSPKQAHQARCPMGVASGLCCPPSVHAHPWGGASGRWPDAPASGVCRVDPSSAPLGGGAPG